MTKHLRNTTWRKKDLFWFTVSWVSAHGLLAPKQKHHGGMMWWRKAIPLMAVRRQRKKAREEGPGHKIELLSWGLLPLRPRCPTPYSAVNSSLDDCIDDTDTFFWSIHLSGTQIWRLLLWGSSLQCMSLWGNILVPNCNSSPLSPACIWTDSVPTCSWPLPSVNSGHNLSCSSRLHPHH